MQTGSPSVASSKPLSPVTLRRLPPCTTRHINQVYRYCLARLGNVHDAEDVAEEIFIKMLAGLPSYQWRKVPFAAWLMRIARNEVVSFTRRNGRRSQDRELPEDLVDRGRTTTRRRTPSVSWRSRTCAGPSSCCRKRSAR